MNFKTIIKSTLISILIAILFIIITALLVYFDILGERVANIVVFSGVIIATFIGAFISSKASESKLLFHALFVGVNICLILLITSSIVNGQLSLSPRSWALLLSTIFSSIIGAIFANKT